MAVPDQETERDGQGSAGGTAIRYVSRGFQIVIDLLGLSLAYWLAFEFRFGFHLDLVAYKLLFFTWPYVLILEYVVLVLFGVPRFAWRYVGLRDATRIALATASSSAVLFTLRFAFGGTQGYGKFVVIPLGVLAINLFLAFLAVVGVRASRRVTAERSQRAARNRGQRPSHRTLLIGAGEAGVMVAKEILARPDLGILPVGFLDDDAVKAGSVIHGLRVLGSTASLRIIVERHHVDQAIISIANAPGSSIRRITELCRKADLPVKIIPGLYEIVGGRVNLSRIRDVAIEDLLGREPVTLDEDAIAEVVRGRVVMVTGAGGSIGSELCRQACRFGPAQLVLVEQAENALFYIHREVLETWPEIDVAPCIADVTDRERMEAVFDTYRPESIFHAAAHKHVPMMEWNPGEAVKNNVLGTRILADLAHDHDVEEFVMISTDKAVNPTSVMGASKRAAEIYVQALARTSGTRFVTVRFGNVLGSAGSVIPIFTEQIANGGPVTVTHPDMRRYFMTIPEACQLVLQAASMGEGGEIFILDMGEPVKIVDLATDLIRLSGLRPGEDVEIVFSGVRPGEKLFEELSVAEEKADKTRHPKIFVGRFRPNELQEVIERLGDLEQAAREGAEPTAIRDVLRTLVPEYAPASLPADPTHAVS